MQENGTGADLKLRFSLLIDTFTCIYWLLSDSFPDVFNVSLVGTGA
jgi:hypothetical protein